MLVLVLGPQYLALRKTKPSKEGRKNQKVLASTNVRLWGYLELVIGGCVAE